MFTSNSLPQARWSILGLAPFQWLLTWCLRYARLLPIHRSAQAALGGIVAAIAVVGNLVLQTALYRSLTGFKIPAHDNYFFAIIIFEDLVSLGIIFRIAFDLHKNNV